MSSIKSLQNRFLIRKCLPNVIFSESLHKSCKFLPFTEVFRAKIQPEVYVFFKPCSQQSLRIPTTCDLRYHTV